MSLLRFVITGPPGSGKGTICAWMVRDFGFKHLSAGDLLRSHIKNKTKEGLRAVSFISDGKLVPDQLITGLIFQEMSTESSTKSHLLLDGFPRTIQQAKSLDSFTSVSSVLDLQVPHDEIISRIAGRLIHQPSGRVYNLTYAPPREPGKDDVTGEPLFQRPDDSPDVVKARLVEYDKNTEPIVGYYREQGLLVSFKGTTSDQIYQQIKQYLQVKKVEGGGISSLSS